MKLSAVKKHIINAYHKKVSVMIWSGPGIGKSSIVKQVAQELNIGLIDVRLPQLEPPDLRGVPVPNRETHRTESYYPEWLPRDGQGIIFLDEIEKAPVAVKNAALQLVLDRRIGSYVVPDGWSIVSAGNREDDGCFSMPLGSALSNRMIHLEVQPDYNVWLEWAQKNNISESILGYLAFRPEHLYKQPDTGTNVNAFPSPRSWEMLNTMLMGVETQLEQNELLEAIIGNAVGKEYRTWFNIYRDIDVERIVVKGELPDLKAKNEQSVIYAITTAVAHNVKQRKSVEGIEANVAKFVSTITPEMRTVFCRQVPPQVLGKLIRHPSFKPIAEELMKVLGR